MLVNKKQIKLSWYFESDLNYFDGEEAAKWDRGTDVSGKQQDHRNASTWHL